MAAVVENKAEIVSTVNGTESKPETATPKTEDKKQPSEAETKATDGKNAQPSNPATTSNATFRGQPDDFYHAIFYFSGMGSVIGSALSEGVYVAEQYRKNAIDSDDLQQDKQTAQSKLNGSIKPREDVVITARGQAQNLSTDFQKLQTLLESLPVFTGNADQLPPTGGDKRPGTVDQPIHGELYFRCKERFPVQPPASSSSSTTALRQTQASPFGSIRSGSGEPSSQADEVRRRRNYDDAVLADVARAAVESFPLMPPPTRQPGSRGSLTPVQDVYSQDDQASRRARRRDVNSSATAPSPALSVGSSASWQQSSQVY